MPGYGVLIVNCAIDASEALLRVVVVQPCHARGIAIARGLACFSIAHDTIEVAQIRRDAGAVGMLLGALHLADHFFANRSFGTAFCDQLLADSLRGAGNQRAVAPYRDGQIAATPKLRPLLTSESHTFVADGKVHRITASLLEFDGSLLRGLRLRCLGFGFFR